MAEQQIDTIDFPIVINVNNQCNIHLAWARVEAQRYIVSHIELCIVFCFIY